MKWERILRVLIAIGFLVLAVKLLLADRERK